MDTTPPPTPPSDLPPSPPPPPPRRRGLRLLVGIGLMGLVAFGAAAIGAIVLVQGGGLPTGGSSGEKQFLEVKLDTLEDAPIEGGLVLDPSQLPPLVTEIAAGIRRAATDEDVTGLYLEIGGLSGGWASVEEVRSAIAAFSASGKPCYAYSEGYDNKSYYLASACTEIYLAPAGVTLVNGLSITNEYYADTMAKIGVKGQFEHVGDFKSAIEPFQRTGPSDAAAEATDTLLDGLYGQMIAGIAAGRKLPEEQVRTLIDTAPITPASALAAGLVNGVKYRDEVADGMAGEERTSLRSYLRAGEAPFSFDTSKKTIAIVHAEGNIVSGESSTGAFGGRALGDESFVETLDSLREDDSVAAVVLRINSPGGSGLAADNMWHAIERLKAAGKPVVASMDDYAASGGYYIAAPTDWIVAQPNTLTGSIGVFGGKINLAGAYENLGVHFHTWQRGSLSNLFSTLSDFNDGERARFREYLESFYDIFLTRVADGREMSKEDVHVVAQGRVWTGAQAKERKLVDELGGLDVAIAKAKELASIPADQEVTLERLPRRKTFFEQLAEDVEEGQMTAPKIEIEIRPELALPGAREAIGRVEMLDRVLADGGIAAMLPGSYRIE